MASAFEKALDFTLGVAILAAEAVDEAVTRLAEKGKEARENAPTAYEVIAEKGRPARESLLRGIRDDLFWPLKGAGRTEQDEITTLEERVASLEQQVSPPAVVEEESPDWTMEDPPAPESPGQDPLGQDPPSVERPMEDPELLSSTTPDVTVETMEEVPLEDIPNEASEEAIGEIGDADTSEKIRRELDTD